MATSTNTEIQHRLPLRRSACAFYWVALVTNVVYACKLNCPSVVMMCAMCKMKRIILLLSLALSYFGAKATAQNPECSKQQQQVSNACTKFSQCFTYDCSSGTCRNGVPLFSLCSDECKKQLDAVTSDCSYINNLFSVEYCRLSPSIGQGASCYQTNVAEYCRVARSTSEYPECPVPGSPSTFNPTPDSPSTPNPTPDSPSTPNPTPNPPSTPNPTPDPPSTPNPTPESSPTPGPDTTPSQECDKQQQQISDACTRLTECFTYDCSSGVCRDGFPLFSLCSDECKKQLNAVTSECSSVNSLFRVEYCQSSPSRGQVASCYWTNYFEFCKVAKSTSEYPECPTIYSPSTQEPSSTPTPSQTPEPSPAPTPPQTPEPSSTPTPLQTPKPSPAPTPFQTPEPSSTPTPSQTPELTGKPTSRPSSSPTGRPTLKLTSRPSSSLSPTPRPSPGLTPEPTFTPSPPLNDDGPSSPTRNFTSVPTIQAQPTVNKSCRSRYLSRVMSGACSFVVVTTVLTIAI